MSQSSTTKSSPTPEIPSGLKTLYLRYFALLREQAGTSGESVATRCGTPAELYTEVRERHGFTPDQGELRVAVNEAFQTWDFTLREGDTVVFLSPLSGG